jgi:hypothetical protein
VEEKPEINAKLKSRYLEVTRQLWSALRCGCRTPPWPCKSDSPTPSSSCSRPRPTAARHDWRRFVSVP